MLEQMTGAKSKAGRVVLIGLDACDPLTVRQMAAAGELPNLARLLAEGSTAVVRNSFGLFAGAVWADFTTGVGPARHRFHCWEHIDGQDYSYRQSPADIHHPPFWQQLGAAGRRIALVDIPHSRFTEPVNGVAVSEWGCHDRHFGFHTQPSTRCAEIDARFGLHPILGMDPYAVRNFAPDDYVHRAGRFRTEAEHKALLDGFLAGAETKTRILEALLAEEKWDLFVAIYGESHGGGHQFWGLHDPAHPDFDPALQAALGGDPIARIYRALDEGVGRLAAQLDQDTTLCVLLSHGMARHHDGTHLLGELLKRLDDAYRRGSAGPSLNARLRGTVQAARSAARRTAEALRIPERLIKATARGLGESVDAAYGNAEARARQAFFIEPNNSVYGGIRFNLRGREANGWVTPEEAERLTVRLQTDLKAVINDANGQPIVRGLHRSSDYYPRSDDDEMPDLFIDWVRDAPIETISSPLIGRMHVPYHLWRTGDHRPAGLLIATGPGLVGDRTLPHIRMQDIPVSLAARLGVTLADVEGEVAQWLAGSEEAQRAEATATSDRH